MKPDSATPSPSSSLPVYCPLSRKRGRQRENSLALPFPCPLGLLFPLSLMLLIDLAMLLHLLILIEFSIDHSTQLVARSALSFALTLNKFWEIRKATNFLKISNWGYINEIAVLVVLIIIYISNKEQ